jgi:hypothetical protein
MIKFNLTIEIVFEDENHFSLSHENVEKFLLEQVNDYLKKDKVEIKNPKVISSLESYKGEQNCIF